MHQNNNINVLQEYTVTPGNEAHGLLRPDGASQRVEPVELFFDLVFVFAVAQLSHALINDLSLFGVMKTLVLFVAVWWVWIYTTWVTNWLVTHHAAVRLMLFALMLLGLLLSISIPGAWESRGLSFALAYAGMQVGRSAFMLCVLKGRHERNFRNFQRIIVWLVASALLWIAGGLGSAEARWAWWLAALAIESVAPVTGFYVPGIGRSTTRDWQVSGEHMAERCGLIVIIALGEMIMLAGVTFGGLQWNGATAFVFVASVIATIAMWWIYFNIGAERAAENFSHAADPGSVARLAYTYLHLPIVFGIVATAAGIELLLAHPTGHTPVSTAAVVVGAPGVFLIGVLLFKRVTAGWLPLSHLVGLGLVAALAAVSMHIEPVLLSVLSALLLVTVAIWETRSLRGRPHSYRPGLVRDEAGQHTDGP